jgi:hypothetical protein
LVARQGISGSDKLLQDPGAHSDRAVLCALNSNHTIETGQCLNVSMALMRDLDRVQRLAALRRGYRWLVPIDQILSSASHCLVYAGRQDTCPFDAEERI